MKNIAYSILATSLTILFTSSLAFAENQCATKGCSHCGCEETCNCSGDKEKCTCKDCQCAEKDCNCKSEDKE